MVIRVFSLTYFSKTTFMQFSFGGLDTPLYYPCYQLHKLTRTEGYLYYSSVLLVVSIQTF